MVEEAISFWFFQDENSGAVPPSILISADGKITDTHGTAYAVIAQPLPAAPGTETTAPGTTTTSASASVPGTNAAAAETPPAASEPPPTTLPAIPEASLSQLQVRVLNDSGVPGAAGRLSDALQDSGYILLPAGNALGRFRASVVYYVTDAHMDEAEQVAEAVAESVEQDSYVGVAKLLASGEIQPGDANVIVLIGADSLGTALREEQAAEGLRSSPRGDVALPLPDDTPRDRFVPGLADIQIFSAVNDNSPMDEVRGNLDAISSTLNVIGRYSAPRARLLAFERNTEEYCEQQRAINPQETCTVQDYEYLQFLYTNLERAFGYFGFTPQNVCGAPAGYSFTDLLEPTREWNEEINTWSGDAIFTTDRLIELHGGPRINPEENLNFYIRQAVQTAHDVLRSAELLDETEAPKLILCEAWISPSGEIPEFANGAWYTLLTPGTQPRANLLSQGTYYFHEIERDGNFARLFVCHPKLGAQAVTLSWRKAGYRAEVVNDYTGMGCQEAFESLGYAGDYEPMTTIKYAFGEVALSAGDFSEFPRVQNQ